MSRKRRSKVAEAAETVRVLQDNVHLNQLKIQEYNQRAMLGAMAVAKLAPTMEQSSWYLDNAVDPRDYLQNEFMPTAYANTQPTQIWNREMGRNYPVFLTEIELRYIRGMGRQLADWHPIGKGVMNKVVNYTAGTGLMARATVREASVIDEATLASVNQVIEDFIEYNDVSGSADQEAVLRAHRDGDFGLGMWHEGGGKVAIRFIEPDQITQPSAEQQVLEWMGYESSPSTMLFGIHTDEDDAASVHGYYVQWTSNGQDWDYIPGGAYPYVTPATENMWCEFVKSNVDRQVKRGISDFFPVESTMRLIQKVVRNTGEGAAVQAAIAFIRQHAPGVTAGQIFQFQSSMASDQLQMSTSTGSRTVNSRKMYPGMVLDIPRGQQYLAGPMGVNNAEIYVEVADTLARFAAVRWDMPEWMLNANTKNNNRASGFIVESPFLKSIGIEQNRNSRFWVRVFWKVLEWACRAGVVQVPVDVLKRSVKLEVVFPQISIREPQKETVRRQVLCENGIISAKQWAVEEGYDYSQQLREGAKRIVDAKKPEVPAGASYNRTDND